MFGIQPVTMPHPPPKQTTLVCVYGVKGLLVVQGAVPCQQNWYQVHAIRGVACVHTS
jgi:hypothetical protein